MRFTTRWTMQILLGATLCVGLAGCGDAEDEAANKPPPIPESHKALDEFTDVMMKSYFHAEQTFGPLRRYFASQAADALAKIATTYPTANPLILRQVHLYRGKCLTVLGLRTQAVEAFFVSIRFSAPKTIRNSYDEKMNAFRRHAFMELLELQEHFTVVQAMEFETHQDRMIGGAQ